MAILLNLVKKPLLSGSRGAARHPLRVGYNGLIDDVNRELCRLIFFFPLIRISTVERY